MSDGFGRGGWLVPVPWIPAFAGMTVMAGMAMFGVSDGDACGRLDSRFRGNDGVGRE